MYAYTLTDLIADETSTIVINAGVPVSILSASELERVAVVTVKVNGHDVTATVPFTSLVCFDSPLDMAGI